MKISTWIWLDESRNLYGGLFEGCNLAKLLNEKLYGCEIEAGKEYFFSYLWVPLHCHPIG